MQDSKKGDMANWNNSWNRGRSVVINSLVHFASSRESFGPTNIFEEENESK